MSKASREAHQHSAEEVTARNKRMQEFNETRDPIFNHMYHELVKTRKWVAFMGVVLILTIIGYIIIALMESGSI